jgi:inosine kinase
MKFPGRRNTKHYFPVAEKNRSTLQLEQDFSRSSEDYVVGIDQLLVDIEIEVTDEFLSEHNFLKGQSFLIEDTLADKIYYDFKKINKITGEYPGGAVGNTLHNYSVLSDVQSYALGAIKRQIEVGDYAFKYLAKTNGLVDMTYLQPSEKPMGRALCFITPDLERTFAISKGCMNDLSPEYIPDNIVQNSSALLISAYTLRNSDDPIYSATTKACEICLANDIPVVMSLGTSELVKERVAFLKEYINKYVSVLAMNQQEAQELTGHEDALLAGQDILEICDLALITVGKKGLYIAAYTDDDQKRDSKEPLVTKSVVNYNEFEYSRAMKKKDCKQAIKIYTHINPFNGGPTTIKNTNGAGDAALSALLHDISANCYHKEVVPNSPKHNSKYLTYSSISQISKYANRVSFEVLNQNSPRLLKGLPAKEEALDDEGYWTK